MKDVEKKAKNLLEEMKKASVRFTEALKKKNLEMAIGFDIVEAEKLLVVTLIDADTEETLVPTVLYVVPTYTPEELRELIIKQIAILHEIGKLIKNETLIETSKKEDAAYYAECMIKACQSV